MKSKTSFFNVNPSLVKEDLKKMWGLPVLYTMILFLANIFPILMVYDKLSANNRYMLNTLSVTNEFNIMIYFVAPISAVVLLFRYLQQNNSVSVIHSLPVTRKELYASHIFTGLFITIIPILITTVGYLIIKKPVLTTGPEVVDLFSTAIIIAWMWKSLLIVFSIFALSAFAAIITGNTGLQAVFSICFVFIISVSIVLFVPFLQHYLYGYYSSRTLEQLLVKLSPILMFFDSNTIEPKFIAFHIVLSLILLVLSYILYKNRHLERSTEPIIFNHMKPAFKYYASFVGMAALGFYLNLVTDSTLALYIGFIIGSFITYVIAEMILNKTVWVFRNLKGYLIFFLIGIVFITVLQFDLTGFEKRIPNASRIESFSLTYSNNDKYNDQDNIIALTNLHKSIIDNKAINDTSEDRDNYYYTRRIELNYSLKNGRNVSRHYFLDNQFYIENEFMKEIFESNEYANENNKILFSNIKQDFISISSNYNKDDVTIVDSADMKDFLNVLKKDLLDETFEENNKGLPPIGYVELKGKENENSDRYHRNYAFEHIVIKPTYLKTISWLKQNDYYDSLVPSIKEVKYISIKRNESLNNDNFYEYKTESYSDISPIPESTNTTLITTSLDDIKQIGQSYSTTRYEKKDFEILIVYKSGNTRNGWYTASDAPGFITNYFKDSSK